MPSDSKSFFGLLAFRGLAHDPQRVLAGVYRLAVVRIELLLNLLLRSFPMEETSQTGMIKKNAIPKSLSRWRILPLDYRREGEMGFERYGLWLLKKEPRQ